MSALTFSQAMDAWISAGGNPQAAEMAAAVASASSGLNPDASITATDGSGVVSRGLWLIPSTLNGLSTNDPVANARAAIQISNNGTDWSNWKTAYDSSGNYLTSGSPAVGALQAAGGSYQVVGSQGIVTVTPQSDSQDTTTPDATGAQQNTAVPATSQTSASASTTGTGSSPRTVILILILAVAIGVYYYMHRKRGAKPPPPPVE